MGGDDAGTNMRYCGYMRSDVAIIAITLTAWALLSGGCSIAPAISCAEGERSSVTETLYFGRATPAGVVSDEDWSSFLRDVVTPRFPAGLTSWQAVGQWQSADGSLTREDSFVVNLVHPPGGTADADIATIVSEYKRRFQQEAVLRVRGNGCASL
jgi:hypothetical protein